MPFSALIIKLRYFTFFTLKLLFIISSGSLAASSFLITIQTFSL